ncbi:MAG TPA: replication factor C small subunit, partial [Gammaproteobacteria bacterium]|nr:replication factor C small subunit [Gammaproteobacteria bacterium]
TALRRITEDTAKICRFILIANNLSKIIWDIATVIGPIATIPNLIALILLRKEIKRIDEGYKVIKNPEQLS